MIDILYVAHNRLEFTIASFNALLDNTDWDEVAGLFVADDNSGDGTATFLSRTIEAGKVPENVSVTWNGSPFGGPVAAMNWYLDGPSDDVDIFAKIDNDFVVCPGWLPEMLKQMTLHPELDILGMEPFLGDPSMPPLPGRTIQEARHIGGKGLLRLRAFSHCRPTPGGEHGYQGFTQWQEKHPEITKAWISPDLPVFGLDQIREEDGHWRARALEYEAEGWSRTWPVYGGDEHYRWWLDR